MNRTSSAAMVAIVSGLSLMTYLSVEQHRARVADEATRLATEQMRDVLTSIHPRAACLKSVSHLDHDVDLGTLDPCPDPADGKCVMYQGKPMPEGIANARCAAGKL